MEVGEELAVGDDVDPLGTRHPLDGLRELADQDAELAGFVVVHPHRAFGVAPQLQEQPSRDLESAGHAG